MASIVFGYGYEIYLWLKMVKTPLPMTYDLWPTCSSNARDIYKQYVSIIPSVQYCPLNPLMQVHVTREPLRTQVPLLWQGFGLQLVGGAGVDDVGIDVGGGGVGEGGAGRGVVGGSETE